MGLWDWIRGKKPAPTPEPARAPAPAPDGPRPHHYQFAHRALPQVAFQDADRFLGELGGTGGAALLNHLWGFVGERVRESGQPTLAALLPPPTVCHLELGTAYVVTLPPALASPEAHLVAFVALPREPGAAVDDWLRYFTLELGQSLEGKPYTVLAAWNSEGTHLNFGPGPAARVDDFAAALSQRLSAAS
jgi:hypothetical protein